MLGKTKVLGSGESALCAECGLCPGLGIALRMVVCLDAIPGH